MQPTPPAADPIPPVAGSLAGPDAEPPNWAVEGELRLRIRPLVGVFASLGGGVAALILSLIFSVLALVPLYMLRHPHTDLANLQQDIVALSMSLWVVVPSLIGSHGTLSLVPFLTAKLSKVPVRMALGLKRAPWIAFVAAPFGVLGLGPTSDAIVHLMRWLAPSLTLGTLGQLNELMEGHSYLVLWPMVALLPGFAEEIFFRGLLQRSLGNGLLAILVSGVAFSVFHMDPHHVAGVLPVGLYLAWVAARTDSTWTTIFAHTVNNSMALLGSKMGESVGSEDPNPLFVLGGLAVTAAAVAVIVYAMRREERA